jgi:hypothetical protein
MRLKLILVLIPLLWGVLGGCEEANDLPCEEKSVQSHSDFVSPHLRNAGERCYEAYNGNQCAECPSGFECLEGYLTGKYLDIGTSYWINTSPSSICTLACSADSDCAGLSFASFGDTFDSQLWSCMAGPSGSYCGVTTDYQGNASGLCDGCGGVFCSGQCIGCSQCN